MQSRLNSRLVFAAACLLASTFWLGGANDLVASNDSYNRPWESRPYKVLVWICSLDSPDIAASVPELCSSVMQRSELADPSAWRVEVRTAPGPWRSQLLAFVNDGVEIDGLAQLKF